MLDRRQFIHAAGMLGISMFAVPSIAGTAGESSGGTSAFGWRGTQFLLHGKPFVIRGGEMHLSRIPHHHWRSRLRMLKAMGLNAVGTYLFWNLYEPRPGEFDFSGQNDIAGFVRMAQEEGLYVILRPGPYCCAEWEFGGFPAWLLKTPDMRVRTDDPRFVAAATRYLHAIGEQLAPLQIHNGGPILMIQVENEYGSFGQDHGYMGAIRDALRAAGFDGLLYTADGPADYMLTGGTLPDVLAVVNFGGDAEGSFAAFGKHRQNVPLMCGEFYPGWFDHWGDVHHTGNLEAISRNLTWMLERDISFSLYMFHGGTTFGFMNGANVSSDEPYQPDTSSYDYGAPLDEAGRPTPAYHALRDLIRRYLPRGERLPRVPPSPPMIAIPGIVLTQSAPLASLLIEPVRSVRPLTMEQLDQNYGFVWYRRPGRGGGKGVLQVGDVRDMALIYQNGTRIGTLDRRKGETSVELELKPDMPLDILVENMGRINYGMEMMDERKGLIGPVRFGGRQLLNWEQYSLPLDNFAALRFETGTRAAPAFHRGTFTLDTLGDSFIDTRGWGRGHVWVNGHHLGRYWQIGPQQTLLVPAQWLRQGENEIIVLELEMDTPPLRARGLTDPVFETPAATAA